MLSLCRPIGLAAALLVAALASPTAVAAPAQTSWAACEFEVPTDGFVALRAAPSREAPMIVRMDPVDGWFMAGLDAAGAISEGRWIYVLYVPPGVDATEAERRAVVGWMHVSLSAGCDI